MLVIPAIDICEGHSVRLRQGNYSRQTVYSENPVDVAKDFEKAGAQFLHLVDLDAAKGDRRDNRRVIGDIVSSVELPVQLGGGIRSVKAIRSWLNAGVHRVIVGTLAIREPHVLQDCLHEFAPEHIVLAVDTREGLVAVEGWQNTTDVTAADLAERFKPFGLKRVLYTDIKRDGVLTGPDLRASKELAERTGLKVTASGGVATMQDIHALEEIEASGVDSVVVGRAFYEGKISLEEAFKC